jgi:transposase
MDVHKNARSCPLSRELLVERVCEQGWSVRAASEAAGMSDRRGREWVRRAERGEPFTDRSSRPSSGRATSPATRVRIVQLRRQWLTIRQIASAVGGAHPLLPEFAGLPV